MPHIATSREKHLQLIISKFSISFVGNLIIIHLWSQLPMQSNQSKFKFNNFFSHFSDIHPYRQPTAKPYTNIIYLHVFRFLSFVIFVKHSNRNQNIFFIHFWFLQHFNLDFIIIFFIEICSPSEQLYFPLTIWHWPAAQQRQSQRNFTKSEYIVIQFVLIYYTCTISIKENHRNNNKYPN